MRTSAAFSNAALDAACALLNSGTIECRTGTPPASVSDAATGTLLGTLTFGATAFAAASARSAAANSITQDSAADADGTIGYCRFKSSGGTAHLDMSVSITGGGGEVQFNSLTATTGLPIAFSSCTVTFPDGPAWA